MKLSDWDSEYVNLIRFIRYRMKDNSLNFFNAKKSDMIKSLELLDTFDAEIVDKFYKPNKDRVIISYKQFEYLCKRYIRKCKKEYNMFGADIFFNILIDMRVFFKVENNKYILYDISKFQVDSTQEEREYAEKTFPHDNFSFLSDDTKIMKYKGLKIYVYQPYDIGFIIDHNKEVKQFQLIWDWWYPIDRYVYLEKGYKFNNDKQDLFN